MFKRNISNNKLVDKDKHDNCDHVKQGGIFFTEGLKDCVYERERLLVSGVDDIALPECDGEGKYKPIQCSYGWDLKCWCADENGNAYSNTSVYSGTPDCSEEGTVGYTSGIRG